MAIPRDFDARFRKNQEAAHELADTAEWLRRESEQLREESRRLIQESHEIRSRIPRWRTPSR
jgi:hypothetical protein